MANETKQDVKVLEDKADITDENVNHLGRQVDRNTDNIQVKLNSLKHWKHHASTQNIYQCNYCNSCYLMLGIPYTILQNVNTAVDANEKAIGAVAKDVEETKVKVEEFDHKVNKYRGDQMRLSTCDSYPDFQK